MYRTDEQIETLAASVRKKLGIDSQARPDMITAIYKMKDHGLIADYRRVPDAELPDDLGSYDPDTRILCIRESTFVAANEILVLHPGYTRARFTIAHEMGHAVLGHKRVRNRNISGREIERISRLVSYDEAEANRFAAAFLMPYIAAASTFSPEQLAGYYGVSITAAKNRKPILEHLHRIQNGIKRPLPDHIVEFLKQARTQGYQIRSLPPEKGNK